MRTRQWGRLLILAAMMAVITMIGASGVAAHAQFKRSDPAPNATVNKAPAQVMLVFSEETSATKSGGSVTDASGATVSTGFKVDLNARTNMAIALKPNLPNGVYTVQWNTLTEDDNGMANGTFTFTVQATATATSGTAAIGTTPAGASAVTGTVATSPTTAPAATTAATATIAATTAPTIAPTTTRPATIAATSTGGTATANAPATLPTTGNNGSGSGAPWAIVIVIAAVLIVAGGFAFRLRSARR